ncbi:glycosyltransferase family 4 protein [Desulforegula conservatrix]|uniref:glycosyltransferase family 4 protein n=1 Tax=Desulforegula conservatrix TaxID=153026 RepID=UPI000486AF28|nr:glycosyltransferase family 4 protein [Desulforegula conservatrix]
MNVLYLLSQRPDSTGSGIYTRALIAKAAQDGHRCSLVAAESAFDALDVSGIKADHIHMVTFDNPPLSFPVPGMSDVMPYPSSRFMDLDERQLEAYEKAFTQAIMVAVEKNRPDIIHSNHLWIMSALARRLYPEIPMVVSCHGTDLRQFRNCPHLRERLIRNIPNVDMIFALTPRQKTEISKLYGMNEEKIHVVPTGFDPDIFYPKPKPASPPFTLLYAGKISQSKGLVQLLESLSHKRLRHLPIHLYVAGSGSGPDKDLCNAIAEKIPDKITFCGSLSPRDLGGMMRKAHVFVLPSFFEGLPLVIIEALASGCRIVATDLPGIRELVEGLQGNWGQLINLPDLETIDRPYDKDMPLIRERLASALELQIMEYGEKEALSSDFFNDLKEKYSWESVFKHVESIYTDLVMQNV